MKLYLFVMLLMLICPIAHAQGDNKVIDSGKFTFLKSDKDSGSEIFTIKDDQNAEASSDLTLGGVENKFKTTTSYNGTSPRSFDLEKEPNIKLSFSFDGRVAKVTGVKEASAPVDPSAVILENVVWYQYYYLIRRYDQQKGGVQSFRAFVPSVLADIGATVELKDKSISLEGITVKLNHYLAVFQVTLQVNIWTTTDGKLVYVTIPSQALEAIRQEYVANLASIHKNVAEMNTAARTAEIDYSAPPNAPYTSEEVTVQAKGHTLGGTLLLPKTGKRPFPVVITITGSGQQTRDEPLPIPGMDNYKPFRQIAEALASKGIAVLRVDDRGVGKSTGLEGLNQATTFDFADDTRAQVAYLRTRPEIDPNRIGLIGHSEGGIIAPMVASTDPKIAAIALMAGTGKTGEKVIMDQVAFGMADKNGLTKEDKEEALKQEQDLLKKAMNGTDSPDLPAQLRLPWFVAMLKYDPLPTIQKVHQPILILNGELDQQVTADQAPMLEKAAREAGNKDVTMKIFPGRNHLFLESKTGAVNEYSNLPEQTIRPDVIDTITTWFQQKLKP